MFIKRCVRICSLFVVLLSNSKVSVQLLSVQKNVLTFLWIFSLKWPCHYFSFLSFYFFLALCLFYNFVAQKKCSSINECYVAVALIDWSMEQRKLLPASQKWKRLLKIENQSEQKGKHKKQISNNTKIIGKFLKSKTRCIRLYEGYDRFDMSVSLNRIILA